jgi:hypothetical protein
VCPLVERVPKCTRRSSSRSAPSGDGAIVALANSPHLANLRELRVLDNPIGGRGALALTESPYLGNLQKLHVPRRCGRASVTGSRADVSGRPVRAGEPRLAVSVSMDYLATRRRFQGPK